ncbi:MAG: hypothetical protein ICV65_02235 [Flavisolibacter sp.]|nr:hypothetical protein [Flavisolibacter sp.]
MFKGKEKAVHESCTLEVTTPNKYNIMTADLHLKGVEIFCAVDDDFLLQHFTAGPMSRCLLREQMTLYSSSSGYKDFRHYYLITSSPRANRIFPLL